MSLLPLMPMLLTEPGWYYIFLPVWFARVCYRFFIFYFFFFICFLVGWPHFSVPILQVKYPSALKSFEQITNHAKGKRIALFLDYDGTLSPIVDNPDCAFMSETVRVSLRFCHLFIFPSSNIIICLPLFFTVCRCELL